MHAEPTNFPLLLIALLGCVVVSCNRSAGPEEPRGGYERFVDALTSRDNDAIWGALSHDTREVAEQAVATLRDTADRIEQLQASDRDDARAATGIALLDDVDGGRALFDVVFDPNRLPGMEDGSRYAAGLRADDEVSIATGEALIISRSGQQFEVVLEDDGQWRVREPMLSELRRAVANIEHNHGDIERAVRLFGLAAEEAERMRRLGLID